MEATRNLTHDSWEQYLETINEQLLNESVSIEIVDPGRPPITEMNQLALQVLSYDRRSDVFEVAGARGGPHLPIVTRHLVDHPTRIAVDSPTSLAPTTIVVEHPEGMRTVIRIGRAAAFDG